MNRLPEPVWDWLQAAEGRFADVPGDRGGRTDLGITVAFHPQEWSDGRITEAEAQTVYLRDYWAPARCGELPLPQGLLLFDLWVQHPPKVAARLWQQSLGGLKVDGLIGDQTVAAGKAADLARLQERYFPRRSVHYMDIVRADSLQAKFLQGWMSRLFKLQRYLLAIR